MNLSEKFQQFYVYCFSIAIFLAYLLSSYFDYNLSPAISYATNDGWCEPKTQGVGIHCFGDYYYPLKLSGLDEPWSGSANPYPPLALFIYKPFGALSEVFGSRSGLGLYLAILVIFIVGGLKMVLKHYRFSSMESTLIVIATIASAPVIAVIDRGNSAIILLPIILGWMINVHLGRTNQILLLTLAACLLRPQFILLSLIFLFTGKTKLFLKSLALCFSAIIFSFFLFGLNPISNILHWVIQLIRYQEYASVGSVYPVNMSFANSLQLLFRLLNLTLPELPARILNYLLFLLFLYIFWRFRSSTPVYLKINAILIAPIFFVGTSFHYYLFVVCLILINSLIENQSGSKVRRPKSRFNSLYELVSKVLFLIILIPWGIPWSILPIFDESRGWPVIGIQWVVGQIVFTMYSLMTFHIFPIKNAKLIK